MSITYGYIFARDNKEEEQQFRVMKELSIPEQDIFKDDRRETEEKRLSLARMEKRLQADDLVYIKNLNCLGNNYDEILDHWRIMTKSRKADVVVLDAPLLDTRRGKEFMETLVSDVVMETLSFVAENEHERNRRRSTETYLAAKARGVQYGRPLSPLPENFVYVYERWRAGKITGSDAAKECGMPISTFRWRANRYREEQENLGAVVNH